jgi:L-ascorbate metabolism protein UlaG (beta-lactamase superfamily)
MTTEITWLGHGSFQIQTAGQSLLIDPFLDDSPTASLKADTVAADTILITHAHFDHLTDAVAIAQRTGATIIANYELSNWFQGQGLAETQLEAMNVGGQIEQSFGRVKMTLAHHSSSLPDGTYGGLASGFLIALSGGHVYFAGDTSLFLDMKLIGLVGLELAVLPIGDRFTMGPDDALEAVKLLGPKRVLPCHYNTWPPIEQDAAAWAEQVRSQTASEPVVVEPGETVRL